MKKRFVPLMLIIIYIGSALLIAGIVVLFWLLLGTHQITITLTGAYGVLIFIYIPRIAYLWKDDSSIVIDETTIACLLVDGKTDNGQWIEEIENIKSIKICTKSDCIKYYKNCSAKRVILIDFGNGNVKYIPLTGYTNRQAQKMVAMIETQLTKLKSIRQ